MHFSHLSFPLDFISLRRRCKLYVSSAEFSSVSRTVLSTPNSFSISNSCINKKANLAYCYLSCDVKKSS